MGRIQKKKDPVKKKAQQAARVELKTADGGGDSAPTGRSAQVIKKPAGIEKSKVVAKDPSLVQKSTQFLREVKIELKKVTWPTRKQTMGSTLVVVILVVIISLFLGLVDMGLSSLIRVVLP
jgi:preprotein translocase subunit SecE